MITASNLHRSYSIDVYKRQVPDALVVSNVAAGIVVGKFGTASVTGTELKEALKEKDIQTPSWRHRDNILTPEAAAELAERFRREKKVVGFTNGCFDLLHMGHLHSFMKAREACDVLFVGLTTDASIKRLKGEDRPINNEEMRSLLLASLDFVDYVVPFDEDTALPLIEKLRPDVIAKEGYPLECWPEGQFVKSYGGQALEPVSYTHLPGRMRRKRQSGSRKRNNRKSDVYKRQTLNRAILEASGLSIGLEANPCITGIASASTP